MAQGSGATDRFIFAVNWRSTLRMQGVTEMALSVMHLLYSMEENISLYIRTNVTKMLDFDVCCTVHCNMIFQFKLKKCKFFKINISIF